MSGEDLYILVQAADDQRSALAVLSDEALRLLGGHLAREGEINGEMGNIRSMAVIESWCRFMAQGEKLNRESE